MYCTSTKVVVIGTNIKRKAGPRIGSLGYISQISKGIRYPDLANTIAYNAVVWFIRYGYEKKSRLEKKRVVVVVPEINLNNNCRKILNKNISALNSLDIAYPILIVSPTTEYLNTENEFCAKVISKLTSVAFIDFANSISADEDTNNANGFYNIANILNMLPTSVILFINEWKQIHKLQEIKSLILKYFYDKPINTEKLFTSINKCEFLSSKLNAVSGKKTSLGSFPLYDNLFDINGFDSVINNKKITKGAELKQKFKVLTSEIVDKGAKVVKKHE